MKTLFLAVISFMAVAACTDKKIISAVTAGETKLTSNIRCTAAQFSPDGTKVAFSGEKFKGIYVKEIAGGNVRAMTDADGAGWRFAWSPDSLKIAARETMRSGDSLRYRVATYNISDGKKEILGEFDSNVYPPVWRESLVTADTDRSVPIRFTGTEQKYIRSVVNEPVVFIGDNRLVLMDKTTGRIKVLAEGAHSPQLSPDGSAIVFVLLNTVSVYDIATKKVTAIGPGSHPSYSPDGRYVIYTLTKDDGKNITASEVRVYETETGRRGAVPVSQERKPLFATISPDGGKILFTDDATGDIFISPMKVEVSNEK